MTKLDAWLTQHRKTGSWLAREIGVDRAQISRMRSGLQTPSLETAVAIFKATDGDVKCEDLIVRRIAK